MKLSPEGFAELKRLEGCRLTSYRDTGGVLTIGYGHTGPEVKARQVISQATADQLLALDVERFEACISAAVKAPLRPAQFDALVCWAFNVGESAAAGSTLVRRLNAGDVMGAANEFSAWRYVDGVVDPILVSRRARERKLFLSSIVVT